MNPMKFFLGLVITLIGFLILGVNLGWFDDSVWAKLFLLWPLFIIVWGLALAIKNKKFVFFLILLIFILSVVHITTNLGPKNKYTNSNYEKISTGTIGAEALVSADININIGAAKVNIDALSESQDSNELLEYVTKGLLDVKQNVEIKNNNANVKIIEKSSESMVFDPSFLTMDNINRNFSIKLNETLPLSLILNCGANKLDANLSRLKITKLVLNTGASDTNITFGDLAEEVDVKINSGASNFVIDVPKETGVKLIFLSGKITNNFDDNIGLINKDDTYSSNNFNSAKKTITFEVKSGVTNITMNQH